MDLQGDLLLLQGMARAEVVAAVAEEQKSRREASDVTGRWLGYSDSGQGLVEYDGKVYEATLLSSSCRQKFALCNLRRTRRGNFVDWQ